MDITYNPPISTRLLNVPLNALVSGCLHLKFSQFVPFLHIFDRFCGFLIKKGDRLCNSKFK